MTAESPTARIYTHSWDSVASQYGARDLLEVMFNGVTHIWGVGELIFFFRMFGETEHDLSNLDHNEVVEMVIPYDTINHLDLDALRALERPALLFKLDESGALPTYDAYPEVVELMQHLKAYVAAVQQQQQILQIIEPIKGPLSDAIRAMMTTEGYPEGIEMSYDIARMPNGIMILCRALDPAETAGDGQTGKQQKSGDLTETEYP